MNRTLTIMSVVAVCLAVVLGQTRAALQDKPPSFVVQSTAEDCIQMGELHPTSSVWVFDAVSNMYIVVLHGHFGGYPHMPKGAVVKGNVAELMFDARHQYGGEKITNKEVDLQQFGTPHGFLREVQQGIDDIVKKR